jgi:phosphonate transport system permease protein
MKTLSNANSAALDNQPFLSSHVWTPRRAAALVAAVFVLVICWQIDEVRLGTIFQRSTSSALWTLLRGLFPPDLSFGFLRVVCRALLSTLATGIAGTFLSVLIAIPLAALSTPILWRRGTLFSADEGNPGSTLRAAASRAVLAFLGFLRAIPDLVWGLLFVTAVGLGSLPGTLALVVSYTGVLGRVYADAFADVDPRPLEALQAIGATRGQIFLRGIWPQARPTVTAYTLYSFECCVRAASVLGFVDQPFHAVIRVRSSHDVNPGVRAVAGIDRCGEPAFTAKPAAQCRPSGESMAPARKFGLKSRKFSTSLKTGSLRRCGGGINREFLFGGIHSRAF